MTQITYQAAFDPFHTMFRILRLRETLPGDSPLPMDTIRIVDYFLVFPFRLNMISYRQEHRSFRKVAALFDSRRPYGDLPDDWTLFGRMEPIQRAAISTLGHERVLDLELLIDGQVSFLSRDIEKSLAERASQKNKTEFELMSVLRVLALDYPLTGPDGLKRRTTLMDHRYDVS